MRLLVTPRDPRLGGREAASLLEIGASAEGRPLQARVHRGPGPIRRRVLVVGGQHGDEPLAMDAVASLAEDAAWIRRLGGVELCFVPCLNPDGLARRTRENAQGLDLNRDHQLLRSPEVRALHELCRGFLPDLVVDVHTYPPRRRALTEHGLELGEEVMLETNNHPASLPSYPSRRARLLRPALERLTEDGIRASRYLLLRASGRIRTSSADVVDARNGLSALFGATSVLIEGREPTRRFGSRQRTRTCVERAVRAVVEVWNEGAVELDGEGRWVDPIPLDAVRLPGRRPARLHTLGPRDRYPRRRALPGRPEPELEARSATRPPIAYAVPRDRRALVELLGRHGFTGRPSSDALGQVLALAEAHVLDGRPSKRPGRATRRLDIRWLPRAPRLRGLLFFFTDAPRGAVLSTLLEPESRFGLHRHADLGIAVVPGRPGMSARALAG